MQITNSNTNKVAKFVLLTTIVLGVFVAGAYWWASRPPGRPEGVPADAVFLWAPHVGLPRWPRGIWLHCGFGSAATIIRCRLTESSGRIRYEGDFDLKTQADSVGPGELRIDPARTRRDWLNIQGVPVPLIYLENGTILIPTDAWDEGLRLLEQLDSVGQ